MTTMATTTTTTTATMAEARRRRPPGPGAPGRPPGRGPQPADPPGAAKEAEAPVRVLIAEDERRLRQALEAVITSHEGLVVVGTAGDAEAAIDLSRRLQPDVVLMDVRMPGGGGIRAAREILRRCPGTRIVGFSAYADAGTVAHMLRAGAVTFVAKEASLQELVRVLRGVGRGEPGGPGSLRPPRAPLPRDRRPAGRVTRLLQEGLLYPVFQPIVELATGKVAGVEALARFRGPAAGRSPLAWFGEAASEGLLVDLELEAFLAALPKLVHVPEEVFLAVNFSPETLTSPRLLGRRGIPWERLVVEVTEHAPVEAYDALREALTRLRGRGARVAVDDGGAGYSSLYRIVEIEPDLVKLDITLVQGLARDEVRQSVVAGLVGLCARIGAETVGEGVETAEDLRALRALGVTHAQGFFLAAPGPLPQGRGAWRIRLPRE